MAEESRVEKMLRVLGINTLSRHVLPEREQESLQDAMKQQPKPPRRKMF